MKKKARKFLLLTLLFLLSIPVAKSQAFNPNLANRLQTTLDSLLNILPNTKGMSAAVYLPGQGLWKGAGGLSYAGNPMTTDMALGLASNSKLYIAVTLLLLDEAGSLSLDDSLHEWTPAFTNVNPNITLRQCLNHTSGLSDPFFTTALLDTINAHPSRYFTVAEVMSYLGAPVGAPGSGYNYSNINYILAGLAAETATGQTMAQLVRSHILTPLDLDSTFYDVAEPPVGVLAHRWENNVDFHDTSRIAVNSSGGPAGSIFTTASEEAQFYHALMNGQILGPGSMSEMLTWGPAPGNYGLGIAKSTFFGNECYGHGGSTIGYKSRTIYDPCRDASVVGLSNSNPSAVDGITALLYKEVVDRLPGCGATLSGPATVCEGESGVTYSVTAVNGATSYQWNLPPGVTGSSSGTSITLNFGVGASSSDISVSGVNAYGPGAPAVMHVQVTQVPKSVSLNGYTLTADSVVDSYQWIDCGTNQAIPGANSQSFTPAASGSYAVVLTLGNCSDTSACTQVTIVGIQSPQAARGLTVYPNPTSGSFCLVRMAGAADGGGSYTVRSLTGQVMASGQFQGRAELDASNWAAGMYLITVFGAGVPDATVRFVKSE